MMKCWKQYTLILGVENGSASASRVGEMNQINGLGAGHLDTSS
jgi:hypothetical protein